MTEISTTPQDVTPMRLAIPPLRRPKSPLKVAERLVPLPWDIYEFVDAVARYRNRQIMVVGRNLSDTGELSGAWLDFETHDVIVYNSAVPRALIDAVVAHEVGHMLHNHQTKPGTPRLRGQWIPDLRDVMCRSAYVDQQEAEAEGFATALLAGTESSEKYIATRGLL